MMEKTICFDMDGTLCDFYDVDGWLDDLMNSNTRPYAIARPRINFSVLARRLNRLQRMGYQLKIISWLSKNGDNDFNNRVTEVKKAWLKKHLPSVKWNEIIIVKYGTPKHTLSRGILFDDEKPNRDNWIGKAFDVDNILEELRRLG